MNSPKVSVIIPVLNDAEDLGKTLDALSKQTYPHDRVEIIVIDNGSTDNSRDIAARYHGVKVILETARHGSPYSARNRGIEASSGDVIALLDSTCIPEPEWLEEAVRAIYETGDDMIGGEVLFWFPHGGRPAEIVDSIINIRMEDTIRETNAAKTANLVVRRDAFDRVGLFREGVRSGEDIGWTSRATKVGLKLSFARKAVVCKRARGFRELLKKAWRISRGGVRLSNEVGDSGSYCLSLLRRLVVPPDPRPIVKRVRTDRKQGKVKNVTVLAVYCTLALILWVQAVGGLYHLARRR